MTGRDVSEQMRKYFTPSIVNNIIKECSSTKAALPFIEQGVKTDVQSMPYLKYCFVSFTLLSV